MGATGEHHVLQLLCLRGQRGIQSWMRVPMNVDPPGGDAIEEAPAIFGIQVYASPLTIGNGGGAVASAYRDARRTRDRGQ